MIKNSPGPCNGVTLGVALALTLGPAVQAQEDFANQSTGRCEMELTVDDSADWRGTLGRGYEVFGEDDSRETFSISIQKSGEACDFFLTAAPLAGGGNRTLTGPTGTLTYDLLRNINGPSFLDPDYLGSEQSRIAGRFGSGAGALSSVAYLYIPPGQFVGSGTYNGQAMIRLFREGVNGSELVAEKAIAIIAPVASVLKVSSDAFPQNMRETGIDFGDLTHGARRMVNFDVVSNADVSIGFQSSNNGKLAHFAGGPGIEYDLMFNGTEVNLSTQYASQRVSAADGQNRQSLPMEIIVHQPQAIPPAGNYADLLTIIFTAD